VAAPLGLRQGTPVSTKARRRLYHFIEPRAISMLRWRAFSAQARRINGDRRPPLVSGRSPASLEAPTPLDFVWHGPFLYGYVSHCHSCCPNSAGLTLSYAALACVELAQRHVDFPPGLLPVDMTTSVGTPRYSRPGPRAAQSARVSRRHLDALIPCGRTILHCEQARCRACVATCRTVTHHERSPSCKYAKGAVVAQ